VIHPTARFSSSRFPASALDDVFDMELVAGPIGVRQDPVTLTLCDGAFGADILADASAASPASCPS